MSDEYDKPVQEIRLPAGWLAKALQEISERRAEFMIAADLCEERGLIQAAQLLLERAENKLAKEIMRR